MEPSVAEQQLVLRPGPYQDHQRANGLRCDLAARRDASQQSLFMAFKSASASPTVMGDGITVETAQQVLIGHIWGNNPPIPKLKPLFPE